MHLQAVFPRLAALKSLTQFCHFVTIFVCEMIDINVINLKPLNEVKFIIVVVIVTFKIGIYFVYTIASTLTSIMR